MPRNIVDNPSAGHAFVEKCKTNDLRVVCVLTKPDEFVRYAGVDGLLEFYRLFIFRTYNGWTVKVATSGNPQERLEFPVFKTKEFLFINWSRYIKV